MIYIELNGKYSQWRVDNLGYEFLIAITTVTKNPAVIGFSSTAPGAPSVPQVLKYLKDNGYPEAQQRLDLA
jgi:hypothetical protein